MFTCTTWYTVLRVLSPAVHALCFVEPKHYALFLRCRKFRNIASVGVQHCSHWQRRRLRRALHLQPGSTTSVQNARKRFGKASFLFLRPTPSLRNARNIFFLFHSIHDNNTSECHTLHQMNRDRASWDERTCSLFLELITQQKNLCHEGNNTPTPLGWTNVYHAFY